MEKFPNILQFCSHVSRLMVSEIHSCSCFQVFGSAPSSDMLEKFPDILQFCSHVSRLMVSEIRRRASNQSTGLQITLFICKVYMFELLTKIIITRKRVRIFEPDGP